MHPIVEQIEPSGEQRPAVTARCQNVVVTAGAGAGKTRTLVARYLSLLAEGLDLPAIVAITFTRKAAREMRNRVRQEIRKYLERSDVSADERRDWSERYERLDAARIGTIHSLCAEILRHHPAVAGIDPRFDMLEEGEMALLQAQAVDTALAWATDITDLVPLYSLFGERSLRELIRSMLQKHLDIAAALAGRPDDLWSCWEPVLTAPIRAFLENAGVQADFAALSALRADGSLARAEAADDLLAPDLVAALSHIDAIVTAHASGDWAEVSRHLAPLRSHLKQKGRKDNWAPATPKDTIASLQRRYDAALADLVKSGIDLDLDRRLARDVLPALLQVHRRAVEIYDRAKQQRRALDFDDLEATALQLLETNPAVQTYWQQQIQALLVDEFQDTNARQRNLLRALNGHDSKLFIVGDAKQSIYRFRGADVTVFRAERRAIEAEGLSLQLSTSYRAHRDLVQSLNALLRPVLGEVEAPERRYVEPFAELTPYREAPAEGLEPPYVELYLAIGTKSDGALDRAARILGARLAELVESGDIALDAQDEESNERRRRTLNYGDIAILCRASTSFPHYENALEQAGIPYLTIAGRGFYDRPEVRDLLNALTALSDPTDDLALAGLLRSPAIGLSDMALYRLRNLQRAEEKASLWGALRAQDLDALEDEAMHAHEAGALIQELNRMVGRAEVAEVLKAFLDRTAYRAMLVHAGETRAANNVSKLLADAHASGIVSVEAFVAYIAELRDVAPREGEARALTTGAVQIMTVHQAKGLEFPVVVLGDASRGSYGARGLLIDDDLGVVMPFSEERIRIAADSSRSVESCSSVAYQLAQRREKDQDDAESDRLLYVAATRARELLIVNGAVSTRRSGRISVSGWLERLDAALHLTDAAPDCSGDGDSVHRFDLDLNGPANCTAQCTIYEPEASLPVIAARAETPSAQALPEDLRMLESVVGHRPQVDEAVRDAERDPPRRVWRVVPVTAHASAPSWVVGNLVHLALRDWAFPDEVGRGFYLRAAAAARNAGLTDEDRIRNAVQRAGRMLMRFQATDLYVQMSAAEERLTEVPYSLLDGDSRLDTGVIDALWRTDAQWHLVEFKTDRIQDQEELERQLREKDYVAQVTRYIDAAERLLGQRPKPTLCLLNYAGRVRLVTDRWG